jgi:hypothetical protein
MLPPEKWVNHVLQQGGHGVESPLDDLFLGYIENLYFRLTGYPFNSSNHDIREVTV